MPHVSRLVSALAAPERQRVFARIVLAGSGGITTEALLQAEPRATRHLSRLADAGLVTVSSEGVARVVADSFAASLEEQADETQHAPDSLPTAVSRFFRAGRLTGVPVRRKARLALLAYLTERVFEPGNSYTEPEVNIALRQYWPDHAALRRYLVDEGFVIRSSDGLAYRRTATAATGSVAAA